MKEPRLTHASRRPPRGRFAVSNKNATTVGPGRGGRRPSKCSFNRGNGETTRRASTGASLATLEGVGAQRASDFLQDTNF
jgi:hypothetical protein